MVLESEVVGLVLLESAVEIAVEGLELSCEGIGKFGAGMVKAGATSRSNIGESLSRLDR